MSTKRKTIAKTSLLCAAAMLTVSVLGACGKETAAPATSNAASTGEAGQTQTLKKITIMANLSTPEIPSDKIEKILEQKTGTDIEIQWVPDGAYEEKFQAAFATGSLPQAAFLKNGGAFTQLRDALKSGQFWEVGPYLKEYPHLSKLNPDTLKNISIEGKIYSLYQERPLTRQGIIYRKDWADKLGLQEPKTTDDIYNMLKKFKEADLGGGGKTLGLVDRSDLVYGSFKTLSSYFGTPNGWGEVDGKLVPEFMTPGYMETMKFLKKLRDEGLMNQDFPVTSKTDQQNMMYTGRAGMYIGSMPDVESMTERTTKNIKDAVFDVTNKITSPFNSKHSTWALPGFGTMVVFPKTAVKTEEEMKQILGFFDKFWSPEFANLLRYGIEGEHYTLQNGKVVVSTDGSLKDKEQRAYTTIALADTTNVTPAQFSTEAREKAEVLAQEAISFGIQDPTFSLSSQTYIERGQRLQEIIKDATYNFILGSIDENGFEDQIKRWEKDGGAKIIEEFNAQYQSSK
ncbi:extracellular solute-binding protein [Paenibacillus turpanensis]|uniref:extracellular solute-binding protein n=1 Tax=Paenibacillus turpanensis TaxID=2689078 RepID=UPI001407EF20|nr:extracellular solute-binding protein [Paenibacillus turpanensis]